jgi:hypothetical protein
VADGAEADRPPRFLEGEMVRVVGLTGSETFAGGEAYDAASLVGEELRVMDAHPNSDADGWLIEVWGADEETDGWCVLFSEDSLTSTGLKHSWDEDGEVLMPLDRAEEPGWRNEIELFLVPDLTEEEARHHPLLEWLSAHPERMEDPDQMTEAAEIGWRAAAVLGEFVGADQEVGLAFAEDDHDGTDEGYEDTDRHPFGIHLWFQPAGEVFAAFDRIISSPAREWEHDIEEGMFFIAGWPASHWRRPTGEDAVFITPGIREAVVICKCWTTPRWHWAHKSLLP